VVKRDAYWETVKDIPAENMVFIDESGLNMSMTRSHAWVKKGQEYIERTPMNWGGNLTLMGAMRLTGWVLLNTMFATTNSYRFVRWVRTNLLPKLKAGDVLILDNLRAHHDPRLQPLCEKFGVRVIYLPPYSHDFNPIESGWALQKQQVRKHAPRTRYSLRKVAQRARYTVKPRHCRQWFKHAGYRVE
jgi:transposase